MVFSRRSFVLLVLTGTVCLMASAASNTRSQPTRPGRNATGKSYKSAIVVDATTGDALFEDRADTMLPPASMTKLMTYAVLHDRLTNGGIRLDTPVPVTGADASMGGTQVFLDPRETFTIEQLIYAMMIQSANDAAHALARVAGGSVAGFVELMNAKARELGMSQTRFVTPHGLPPHSRRIADGDLTTPRDFAKLCRHLVNHTDVLKYTSVTEMDFGTGVRAKPLEMRNHNKLVGKVEGVDGLKTGYTEAAGYCLSATALRNGRRVIAVVMGSLGPNGQRDYGRARDIDTVELLERGFAALPAGNTSGAAASPISPVSPVAPAPVPTSPTPKAGPPASPPAAPPADSPIQPAPPPSAPVIKLPPIPKR